MAYSYLVPGVTSLQPGYRCTIKPILSMIQNFLVVTDAEISVWLDIFCDGEKIDRQEKVLSFRSGSIINDASLFFSWPQENHVWGDRAGYIEFGYTSVEGKPIFRTNLAAGIYAIFSRPGYKSFISDLSHKYSSPPTIQQIAIHGRYIDGYSPVLLDRVKNYGETIVLINPYRRPIIAEIRSHDGQTLPRIKILPQSAENVSLAPFLLQGQDRWEGRIQLTASNRLITFSLKHLLSDPSVLCDHEHLDPYRGDATHGPWFQRLRSAIGTHLSENQLPKTIKKFLSP